MKRHIVLALYLASSLCFAQTDGSRAAATDVFTPFDTRSGATLADEREREAVIPSATSQALPVDETLYAADSYIRVIERLISDSTPRELHVAGKVLDESQQKRILNLLAQVRSEDERWTIRRVEAMCSEWGRDEPLLSPQVRADRALSLGKELEIRYWAENTYRVSMLNTLAEIIEVDTEELLSSIDELRTRRSARLRSWSDMVRNVGREVEQFEMMCSPGDEPLR